MNKESLGRTRLKKKEPVPPKRRHYLGAISRPAEVNEMGLLLRHPDFVAKLPGPTPEKNPSRCEASALTN